MSNIVNVVKKDLVKTHSVSSFVISVVDLILNQSVAVNVCLYDENNILTDTTYFNISGDEYSNWGSNDQYLKNLIAEKLGLTIIS